MRTDDGGLVLLYHQSMVLVGRVTPSGIKPSMNDHPLQGIIPPLATPLRDDESIDTNALIRLVDFQIKAGVHGLWVLGTTARFDLLPDDGARKAAEIAIEAAAGRVPMVLNVSDMGTRRTLARAARFDDLPYDYYAALPPWYQLMARAELLDYFRTLADRLALPLILYNAPWINNQLTFEEIKTLAEHPRIVGVKDVHPGLNRGLDWPAEERQRLGFSYMQGFDLVGLATALGTDGYVTAMANPFPELCVATYEAALAGDAERSFRLQAQLCRLSRLAGFGPMHACLEAACRHRGLLDRMLPAPLRSLNVDAARRIAELIDEVGALPEPLPAPA
ncbi:hypothetical protein BH23PLA1_BH23PLA1_36060 [soil metagenome]